MKQYHWTGRSVSALRDEVASAVRRGDLSAGERLPSVRALAAQLAVSPSTVASAYAELRRQGVVVTRERGGTRVNDLPPLGQSSSAVLVPPGVRDLATGNPDPLLLPSIDAAVRAALAECGRGGHVRLYGEDPSVGDLVALVRQRRVEAVGRPDPDDDGVVVSGALDAIERVLAAIVPTGGAVALEDPGYDSLLGLVRALGLKSLPVRVDGHGPRVDDLRAAADAGAGTVVITSRGQNPTGAALDAARASEVAQLLGEYPRLTVIENDHLGDIAGTPLYSTIGGSLRWAYVRSLAKTLGPDLRIAVLLGDPDTISRVRGRQSLGPGWVSELLQRTALHLLRDPAATNQVDRARRAYQERRFSLLEACAARDVPAFGSSGFNVWVPVDDETTAVTALLTAGWAVSPGNRYRQRTPPGIRITTADLTGDEAQQIADTLALLHRQHPRRVG